MSGIILFGAGSPICADVAETCRRNGTPIAAAIRNVPGVVHVDDSIRVVEAADVTPDIAALPFVLPLFRSKNRRAALAAANAIGFRTLTQLVDRTVILGGNCRIEAGTYVNAGVIVGSCTVLERLVFCNRGANIGHHCRIGPFVSIGPGALLCGSVTVGEGSLIGAGAIIHPKVTIGEAAKVAAGAVVVSDVPADALVAGNPARIVPRAPAAD